MASLLLTASRPSEDVSYSNSGEGKVCPSPMSTFGSDFNDNLFLEDSNAQTFSRADYTDLLSKTTNNLQLLAEPEQVVKSMEDDNEDLHVCDQTEEAAFTEETVKITVFATNAKKSDIECEKDKYYIKVKTKVKIKKHKKNCVKNVKKEKRKNVTEDFGFLDVSLFPRPSRAIVDDDENALERYYAVEQSLDEFEDLVAPYKKELDIEGNYMKMDKHLRCDKDRRIRKAHIQVKDKYCKSVKNNEGRKSLYVHHRVYKLMELETQRLSYMPSQRRARQDIKREEMKEIQRAKSGRPVYNSTRAMPAGRGRTQNLAYAIDNNNAAQDLDNALVNLLITLQHRDLTPEDYETLLRLDETVAPKTLQMDVVASFKTDIVNESCVNDTCAICMDQYALGQSRKFLPCKHVFHANCIDMWLQNSSLNCPIDNLPVDVSNS
ncbi:uncharacterized protein LOC117320704 [Pecten maximus]|uniref:uncharacterized protein LOC117320704 n=1 Tax=Pecten maximus TaxID=6579 RepID=UPI0014584966|nr:uncharacterized protein LOC117320704 [Pecten maximus]